MEFFYEWIQNIAFFLVVVNVVIQMIPDNSYRKYIRFFMGLLLIVMLSGPIIKAFGMQQKFSEIYTSAEYKQKIKEIEETTKYLENISLEDVMNGD